MKKVLISLLIGLVTVSLVVSLILSKGTPKIMKSAVKNSYDEVTSKLDQGGNLYLYVSTERAVKFVEELGEKLRKIVETQVSRAQSENIEILKIYDFVFGMIKKCGMTEISGIGVSSVAMDENLNHNKVVVHHYREEGKGLIWQLLEEKPHELDGLKLLPADTVLAEFCDFRPKMLWQWIKKEVEASDVPKIKQAVLSLEPLLQNQGIQLDKLLDSFSGRMGYVLSLDSEKKVTIPLGQTPLEIPEPGLAFVFTVKDDTIFNLLQTKLPFAQKSEEKGIKKLTIPIPPMPVPLKPEIVQKDGMLILASCPSITEEILTAKEKGNGLTTTAEFKNLSAHIPQEGNSFQFTGSRFFHHILDIQKKAMEASGEIKDKDMAAKEFFDMLPKDLAMYGVLQNTDEGLVYSFNHNLDLELVVLLPAIQVTGIVAALVVPNAITAVQKAKQKSTMKDLKTVSLAIEDYITDNGHAPRGKTLAEIKDQLQPFYIKTLPLKDSWGNDFVYTYGTGNKKDAYAIGSGGRDGIFQDWDQTGFYFVTSVKDFDNDIIIANGTFTFSPRVK